MAQKEVDNLNRQVQIESQQRRIVKDSLDAQGVGQILLTTQKRSSRFERKSYALWIAKVDDNFFFCDLTEFDSNFSY